MKLATKLALAFCMICLLTGCVVIVASTITGEVASTNTNADNEQQVLPKQLKRI